MIGSIELRDMAVNGDVLAPEEWIGLVMGHVDHMLGTDGWTTPEDAVRTVLQRGLREIAEDARALAGRGPK